MESSFFSSAFKSSTLDYKCCHNSYFNPIFISRLTFHLQFKVRRCGHIIMETSHDIDLHLQAPLVYGIEIFISRSSSISSHKKYYCPHFISWCKHNQVKDLSFKYLPINQQALYCEASTLICKSRYLKFISFPNL